MAGAILIALSSSIRLCQIFGNRVLLKSLMQIGNFLGFLLAGLLFAELGFFLLQLFVALAEHHGGYHEQNSHDKRDRHAAGFFHP